MACVYLVRACAPKKAFWAQLHAVSVCYDCFLVHIRRACRPVAPMVCIRLLGRLQHASLLTVTIGGRLNEESKN